MKYKFYVPGNLVYVYLTVVGIYVSEAFVKSLFPPFLAVQGYNAAAIGGIMSIFTVMSLVSRVPSGLLYRPGNVRIWIAAAMAIVAIITFSYPYFLSPALVSLLRLIHGFSLGVATTLNMALFFDIRPANFDRGRAMGLFSASLSAGFMIGSLAGGAIADQFGFSVSFKVAAMFALVAGIFNLLTKVPATTDAPGAPTRQRPAFSWQVFTNQRILFASIVAFSLNFLHDNFGTFFPLYGLAIGLSLTIIGGLKSISSFIGIFTRIFASGLSRFFSYDFISIAGIALSVILIIVISNVVYLPLLLLLVIVLGAMRSVVTVTAGAAVIEATASDPSKTGMASATFNMGKDMGNILGPLVGGFVAQAWGIPVMMRISSLSIFLTFIVLMLIFNRRQPAHPVVATSKILDKGR